MTESTHNGDHNVAPISDAQRSDAARIMDNPAAAAEQSSGLTSPHISDPGVAKLLDQMPGLVGAIDAAVKDTAGKPLGFMLIVFAPGTALHATNCNPQHAQAAVTELVKSWEQDGRGNETPIEG